MQIDRQLISRINMCSEKQKLALLTMLESFGMSACDVAEETTREYYTPVEAAAPEPPVPQSGPTLERYATDVYMRRKSATFSQNATISYNNAFKRIFKYLGHMHMRSIRPVDINDFFLTLQTQETALRQQRDGKLVDTGKPLAHSSIIKYYTVLHNMFADAYRLDELIPFNPMEKVARPSPRKDDKVTEMGAYSLKEAQYLLECLAREPLISQIMVRLLLDTGCRRGEIAGLRWQDVDFDSSTIKICNNLQYSAKKGNYNTTPKGNKNRVIDVDAHLMELLRELKITQPVKNINDYCFVNRSGKVMSPQYATQYLLKFGRKYNIKNLHPHALRHTAASIAIISGADVASVSAKLGHADKSTTLDMYTHTNTEAIRHANEIYRNALYDREA